MLTALRGIMRILNKEFGKFCIIGALLLLAAIPVVAQDDEVAVVMTRESGLSNQIVIIHTDIPWGDIRARYQQEYISTILSGGSGGWVTVISQGYPSRGQILDGAASPLLLQVKIDAVLKDGKIITDVDQGGGQWVISISQPLQPQRQQVLVSETFPTSELEKLSRSGWSVTSMAWGDSQWVIMVTEKTGYKGQQFLSSSTFPVEEVTKAQSNGYRVTSMERGEGKWHVVLTKGTGWGEQQIFVGANYPTKEIDQAWDRGYHITALSWSASSTLPTMAFDNLKIESRLERVADLTSGLWYDEFIKNNAGTEYGFVAVQRMAGYYVANRQWSQAVDVYNRYQSYFPDMKSRFDKIITILNADDSSKITNLGSTINTRAGEFMPLTSTNDRSLYFTGMNRVGGQGGEDIFIATKEGGLWNTAKAIPGTINTANHEFGTSVAADETKLVLFASRQDGMGNGDLYYSDKERGSFGPLTPFPKPINSEYWDCDGFLTSDGKAMIFSSDRPGGIGPYQKKDVLYRGERWGNVDIWVSVKNDTGWSEPINLGPSINTPWAERSPFLHPDGRTLYFCSSGHPGLGKLDIFVSKRLREDSWTGWSEPVNLGRAINGVGSDWGYRVNTAGTTAYFAAENLPGSYGLSDIYAHELPQALRPLQVATIRGTVTNEKGAPLQAQIKWEDLSTSKVVGELRSDAESGEFFITLPLGKNYGYYADKEGYYPVARSIDLRDTENGVDIEVNIVLTPIEQIAEEGASIRLNNIFFDVNKATLKEESKAELDRFAKLLERFPNGRIEISGHTDSTASASYNKDLSQRRAQSVVDYLVSKGFSRKNFRAVGYGEEKPVADNGTEVGRALNRRVEFRFLKKEEL